MYMSCDVLPLCKAYPSWATTAIVVCLLSILCASFVKAILEVRRRPAQCTLDADEPTALDALLQLFTPNCSHWPSYYLNIASIAHRSENKTVKLMLSVLLRDLENDQIELASVENLSEVVTGKINRLGWTIMIEFKAGAERELSPVSTEVLELNRILDIHYPEDQADVSFGIDWPSFASTILPDNPRPPSLPHAISPQNSNPNAEVLTSTKISLSRNTICLTLDFVPLHQLSQYILKLRNTMIPAELYSIEFSARSTCGLRSKSNRAHFDDVLPLSTDTALNNELLAVPFRNSGSVHQNKVTRTDTALYTTLSSIIGLLTTGSDPLEIVQVNNISHHYTRKLRSSSAPFDEGKDGSLVASTWGRCAFENTMRQWEAAIFPTVDGVRGLGILQRYVLMVRKPDHG